jgi:hypothetical protein
VLLGALLYMAANWPRIRSAWFLLLRR